MKITTPAKSFKNRAIFLEMEKETKCNKIQPLITAARDPRKRAITRRQAGNVLHKQALLTNEFPSGEKFWEKKYHRIDDQGLHWDHFLL